MGFFDSVLKVISAPVTVPAKVFSNVAKTVGGDSPIAKTVSNAFAAPYEVFKDGVSGESIARAKDLAGPVLNIAQSAFGASGGSLLGFSPDQISGFTDIFGNNPGGDVKPLAGGASYQTPAPATPLKIGNNSGGPDLVTMAAVVGGAGFLAYLLFRSKK